MSRIGKLPIEVPAGVEVTLGQDMIKVKGPKGELTTPAGDFVTYEQEGATVTVKRQEDSRKARAQHGLRRTLLANCIEGVAKGFTKVLEVNGVGYKVAVKGGKIEMALGFSHPVLMDLPKTVDASVEGNKLTLTSPDKALLGEVAARIRRVRPPEPYKGKGIKYADETIRRKAGKSGGK